MKKIYLLPVCLFLLGIGFFSCTKDLPTYESFEAYQYSGLDADGGDWTPVLLSSSAQIGIPAPLETTSSAYQNDLAALKNASANISSEQQDAVNYWGTNGLLRWNEIARELAAKYFLPPAPNADGTYSVPNSAQPDQYPYFPFAHPPYTCRMLAYWSAAQFDALTAAWHYKYQYNRPAAWKVDPTIKTHLPQNDLPGFPSEDAVIAAVSKTILTAMFPLEKNYIAAKAAEHVNSRLWAGMNVQEELTVGDSLGRAVAAVFINRSKTDGMKNAQAPRAISDSLRDAAQSRFGWHWENLEVPQRPIGITPLFGRVKPWFIPGVEAVRPPAPPAPGSAEFQAAADELKRIADNLTDEQRHIAIFWSDGAGTYTPPGHWNRLAAQKIAAARFNPLRTARTFAYLNTAVEDAGISCWDAKYYYHYPRPSQAIPGFKTILGIPNFPSYTSGHSTFSGAAAVVLGYIFPSDAAQFDAWAQEAADSRVYGGIHFRFDSEAGLTTGRTVGNYAVERARKDGAD